MTTLPFTFIDVSASGSFKADVAMSAQEDPASQARSIIKKRHGQSPVNVRFVGIGSLDQVRYELPDSQGVRLCFLSHPNVPKP